MSRIYAGPAVVQHSYALVHIHGQVSTISPSALPFVMFQTPMSYITHGIHGCSTDLWRISLII